MFPLVLVLLLSPSHHLFARTTRGFLRHTACRPSTWRRPRGAVDQTAGGRASNRSRSTRPSSPSAAEAREGPGLRRRSISRAEPRTGLLPGRPRWDPGNKDRPPGLAASMASFGAGRGRDGSIGAGAGRFPSLPCFGLDRSARCPWVGILEALGGGGSGGGAECVRQIWLLSSLLFRLGARGK